MTTVQETSRGLTAAQIEFFHREGYLVLPDLFGNEDLQPAIDDINRAIDAKVVELLAAERCRRATPNSILNIAWPRSAARPTRSPSVCGTACSMGPVSLN